MRQEKTFYLTQEGFKKLEREFQKLKELRKIRLGKEAPTAFFSEELNAEFVSFRDDMDLLDAKLEELEYVLKNHEIIKPPSPDQRDHVALGAVVTIEVDGKQDEFLMVGTLEANPSLGRISNESPVGRALFGLKVGDEAVISSPIKIVYRIKKIRYK